MIHLSLDADTHGTVNPTAFLDVTDTNRDIYITNEYYYDSKKSGHQKTNEEYADDFEKFVGDGQIPVYVIVDPAAADFRLVLQSRGYHVKLGKNDVLEGIRAVGTMFNMKAIHKLYIRDLVDS